MNGKKGPIKNVIREFLVAFDTGCLLILGWIMELFFDLASAQLFNGDFVYNLFSRIQLIIGIFMIFKLTISVLQAVVNPEKLSDNKNGFSSVIIRVLTCLFMLTMLVPINYANPKTDYELQLNNNGILFGTLYSLQNSIINNNTVGKLIMGSKESSDTSEEENQKHLKMKGELINNVGKIILQKAEVNGAVACPNETENYDKLSYEALFNQVNETCSGGYYLYSYTPLIGLALSIAFIIIFIGLTIDVGIRAIKLFVLRLIAPIPILSYLDPNQAQKGAFANWTKMLISTYLELFIRLATVYLVFSLIKEMTDHFDQVIVTNGNSNHIFLIIMLILALLLFAQQAPKFIQDALGIQKISPSGGLASVLGGVGGAVGAYVGTRVGGGNRRMALLSAFQGGAERSKAAREASASGKPAPPLGYGQWRDKTAQTLSGDPTRRGGLLGKAAFNTREKLKEKNADQVVPQTEIDAAEQKMFDRQNGLRAQAHNLTTQMENAKTALSTATAAKKTASEEKAKKISERASAENRKNKIGQILSRENVSSRYDLEQMVNSGTLSRDSAKYQSLDRYLMEYDTADDEIRNKNFEIAAYDKMEASADVEIQTATQQINQLDPQLFNLNEDIQKLDKDIAKAKEQRKGMSNQPKYTKKKPFRNNP